MILHYLSAAAEPAYAGHSATTTQASQETEQPTPQTHIRFLIQYIDEEGQEKTKEYFIKKSTIFNPAEREKNEWMKRIIEVTSLTTPEHEYITIRPDIPISPVNFEYIMGYLEYGMDLNFQNYWIMINKDLRLFNELIEVAHYFLLFNLEDALSVL